MSHSRKFAILMLMSVAAAPFAMAQNQTTPPSSTTRPSQSTTEPNATEPSSASSPHQRQAMHDQMMKECMQKEHDKDSTLSKSQIKKNCQDQMKMQKSPTG